MVIQYRGQAGRTDRDNQQGDQMKNQDKIYVVNTAVEGAINYWAGVGDYDCDAGTCILVVENEETEHAGKHYPITPDTIDKGLEVLKKLYPISWKRLVTDNYDSNDADACLQAAIFGQLIFG
jgi:hypothetical protein